ncbi:universal stress protein [Desulfogranum japonicum]|uniref:universal stress protein n=1 Tax=Desulfogranum japonicum TaxID=231447 RepID=UPI00048A5B85|nr:universal stress protein [Desulfogranum japonicum]
MKSNAIITPVILIVTRNCRLSSSAMQFSLASAERLGFRVLVVFVNTWPFLWEGGRSDKLFREAAYKRMEMFRQIASTKNVSVDHVFETGKVSKVVHRLCRLVRNLDFIVLDHGIQEYSAATATVPVFIMRKNEQVPVRVSFSPEKKVRDTWNLTQAPPEIRGMAMWAGLKAIALMALYMTFILQADTIMEYWTKGGCYGVLPACTAWLCCYLQYSVLDSCKTLAHCLKSPISPRKRGRPQRYGLPMDTHRSTPAKKKHMHISVEPAK